MQYRVVENRILPGDYSCLLLNNAARPMKSAIWGMRPFERHVRPAIRPEDDGKFYAIDIDTGDYEINEDDYTAVAKLRARRPSAEVWLGMVGQPAAYKMRKCR